MNLGTQKWKKAWANFAGMQQCGAMRRGVHAGMPMGTLACPMPTSLGANNLFFPKEKPLFLGNHSKFMGK